MNKPTQEQLIDALDEIVTALSNNQNPTVTATIRNALYCFSAEALAGDPDIKPQDLDAIITALTTADLPTFIAARDAAKAGSQAWLGFKIVTDASLVLDSTDTSAWNFNGPGQGSADVMSGAFFSTADKDIVFAREFSARDRRQMLDVTRGPHMHNSQYAGVAWTSIPLEPQGRVIMLGAGDVSMALEKVAALCGFDTVAVDDDSGYLNAERFPGSLRVQPAGWATADLTSALDELAVTEHDYICVLTRGHSHDTEAIIWAAATPAAYIGMMGHPMKNERVFALAKEAGVAPEQFANDRVFAPIGITGGGKAPAELAVSITMQLSQIRNRRRQEQQR